MQSQSYRTATGRSLSLGTPYSTTADLMKCLSVYEPRDKASSTTGRKIFNVL